MASGTRGRKDLEGMRDLVGASKPLSQTDLPSLRDLLSAGLDVKETSLDDAKQQSNFGLCENLADQLIAIYSKANVQFVPGQNMMPRKSIINKILIDWKIAMEVASHKKFKKKENLLKRMDKLYPVLYCICTEILSCQEKGCISDCKKQAHTACSCLKEEKIPVIELLFIRDQRARNTAGLSIGLVDIVESQRIQENLKIVT